MPSPIRLGPGAKSLGGFSSRKPGGKDGALLVRRLDLQRAAMSKDDVEGDEKAEAEAGGARLLRSRGLRGELDQGIEHHLLGVGRNRRTVVLDAYDDRFAPAL